MFVGGGLFTWIITLKKKSSFWNPGGSFSFVAETALFYSTGKTGQSYGGCAPF